jgi:hypothetical protein
LHFDGKYSGIAGRWSDFEHWCQEWQVVGSVYVVFAQRLGIGSLLYLHEYLLPSQCEAASAHGWKIEAQDLALEHLEYIGLPDLCEKSGANDWMRALLELLCRGFGTFDCGDTDAGDVAKPSRDGRAALGPKV